MIYPISIDSINNSTEFYSEIIPLVEDAKSYLFQHSWCKKISSGWLFTNIGYAVCIFLFEIENAQSKEDNLIWVIVGDFPSMYLDTYNVHSTKEVLETYIELVNEWITTVESKQSLDECYPLNSLQTDESLEMLKKRIGLLENQILSNIDEINFSAVFGNSKAI